MATYPTTPPGTTLASIQQKVRRITRSPSEAQLTTDDLNNYINTFVLYDFPEHLRTFNLLTQFTFYTNIGQDSYPTDELSFAGAVNNPLYNFQNLYISIEKPVYIAGFPALYSQSREQFYGIYPFVNNILTTGYTGNGSSGPFTGVINTSGNIVPSPGQSITSILQNNVLFSATGTPGTSEVISMSLVDVPLVDPSTGYKINLGNLYVPGSAAYQAALINPPTTIVDPNNFINYLTGQFSINFPMATVSGTPINSQAVYQVQALPQALLYYNNIFTVRPIPDQSYAVNFQAYVRPVQLLQANQSPELEQWWQYIAWGTAKKVFEDRMDMDSVQLIIPEYRKQENLVLRSTIVQQTTQRTASIYTEQTGTSAGYGGWGWSGSNF